MTGPSIAVEKHISTPHMTVISAQLVARPEEKHVWMRHTRIRDPERATRHVTAPFWDP
ncbi:hypothetical protein AB9K34_17180 [Sedimentitalea sp. XS_ASV28]|uniref:hypothetical protein n=1 Tax=Sedimentitalea sp. XS_ASV28 TaxID=3241296 RepID=UPI00351439D9